MVAYLVSGAASDIRRNRVCREADQSTGGFVFYKFRRSTDPFSLPA